MFLSPRKEGENNSSTPCDDSCWSFIQFIFLLFTPTDACRNENGGDFGFLWISIDRIEMMLISTYHLMMFLHLRHYLYFGMCRVGDIHNSWRAFTCGKGVEEATCRYFLKSHHRSILHDTENNWWWRKMSLSLRHFLFLRTQKANFHFNVKPLNPFLFSIFIRLKSPPQFRN